MAKQSGIEIQSTIENIIVEDTTAHSGAENSVGDFNSLASKTSSNNSLNHQSQQIVQDSSVVK